MRKSRSDGRGSSTSDTSLKFLPSLRDSMCFGYFDLGLASKANTYHRFAILELASVASSAISNALAQAALVNHTIASDERELHRLGRWNRPYF